jgi:hypothetical protein
MPIERVISFPNGTHPSIGAEYFYLWSRRTAIGPSVSRRAVAAQMARWEQSLLLGWILTVGTRHHLVPAITSDALIVPWFISAVWLLPCGSTLWDSSTDC